MDADGNVVVLQPRTDAQETVFRSALKNMHVLYAHDHTLVLRLEAPIPETARNPTPYNIRGWCVFEKRVSSMKSITTNAVSLATATTDLTLAPTAPGDFREELKNLKFTNGGDA